MTDLFAAETTPQLGIRTKTPDARAFINAGIVVSPQVAYDTGVLLIKDGRVLDVGEQVRVPDGFLTVDLQGKSIYPGFIDPFTDYDVEKTGKPKRWGAQGPQYETERIGANSWNAAIHAEKSWAETFKPNKKESEELMKLGFTTVLTARKNGIFRGRAAVALLGEGLPNDLLICPQVRHVGSFDKGSSTQDYPSSRMGAIALIRQTLYDVDWYNKAHRAFTLNPNQEMPEFNAAIQVLADVVKEGIIFDGGQNRLSLFQAARIAEEFTMPMVIVGSGYEYARIKDVKATGATLILPLDFPQTPSVKTLEDQFDVTLSQLRHRETAASNPARLDSSKIPFAFTTHRMNDKTDFRKNL
ncbi:MAG: amidohydrolase, partial [Candidatus Zixiibacteriota bacterium]